MADPRSAGQARGPEKGRPARLRAALFDLDGTLVDSVPDIAEALTDALAPFGRGPFPEDQVRSWVGGNAQRLVAQALGVPLEALDPEAERRFLQVYAARAVHLAVPYPGTERALASLRRRGVALAICTNKPRLTTDPTLAALGWTDRFDRVLCPDDVPRPKPAPDMLLTALEHLGVDGGEAAYVGDSDTDSLAAHAAGLPFAFAAWGYGAPRPGDRRYAGIDRIVQDWEARGRLG
jgi:phosphoglycolate phosphatase